MNWYLVIPEHQTPNCLFIIGYFFIPALQTCQPFVFLAKGKRKNNENSMAQHWKSSEAPKYIVPKPRRIGLLNFLGDGFDDRYQECKRSSSWEMRKDITYWELNHHFMIKVTWTFEGFKKCKKIIEVIMSTTSASHYKKPLEYLIAYVLYVMQVNLLQKLTTSREYRYVNKVLWIFCLWEVGVVSILKLVKILSNSIIHCLQSLCSMWKLKPRNCSSLSML